MRVGLRASTPLTHATQRRDTDPRFAVAVALLAVRHLLAGGGYDPAVSDTSEAIRHLLAAACRFEAADWARQELDRLAEAPCAPGREPFRQAVRTALSCAGT